MHLQVSTLASWTSIAYTSWYGCENFLGDPYGSPSSDNPSIIHTLVRQVTNLFFFLCVYAFCSSEKVSTTPKTLTTNQNHRTCSLCGPLFMKTAKRTKNIAQVGDFQGFRCDKDEPKPAVTFVFFSIYIVITSWVIMSLFIGVISMGMFEAFEAMKNEAKQDR